MVLLKKRKINGEKSENLEEFFWIFSTDKIHRYLWILSFPEDMFLKKKYEEEAKQKGSRDEKKYAV